MARGRLGENKLRGYLESTLKSSFGANVYIQKNHGSVFSRGLPDLEILLYGKHGYFELKAESAAGDFDWLKLTGLQLDTLRLIYEAGGTCGVIVFFGRLGAVNVSYDAAHYLHRSLVNIESSKTTFEDMYRLYKPDLTGCRYLHGDIRKRAGYEIAAWLGIGRK